MKKMYKALCFVMCCVFSAGLVFAGGRSDKSFELTEQQKKDGWRYFMPLGIKIHRPAFWDKYGDNLLNDSIGDGYDTPDEAVFKAYIYAYAIDSVLDANARITARYQKKEISYEQAIKDYEKEVLANLRPLYGLFVLRTNVIKGQDLKEITGYPIVKVLNQTKEYTQVMAMAEFSAEGLKANEAAIYKEMIGQLEPASETITCTKPILPEDILLAIKNLKFDTIDLAGNKVTNKIFKDYDVTMINMWATWCGPCRKELPEIAKLYENFKGKKCNIIGITGDVTPESQDALELAKKLTSDAGCKYTILQNNDSLKDLFKGLPAWPCTIFVDKNGTIIASDHSDIIVGSMELEEFTEAFENALKKVKK